MKNMSKCTFRVSAISLAVTSLFVISAVRADDEEMRALTQPKSSVQVEAINVDNSSAKFGEYNGLNRQGGYINGALDVRGGSGYDKNEQGDTTRWAITGDNLGLTSRSAGASISDQGSWSLGVGFDQLQHNISDSYQTPYQGNMGGGSWILPSNFGTLTTATSTSNPTYNNSNGTRNLSNTQKSDFNTLNISSTRYNTSVGGKAIIDVDSNITFDYNNLTQTGAKLQSMGAAGMAKGGAIGETASILPMPTNYQTDTVNLAYNWKSKEAHLTASYFGSFFTDGYNGVSFQPWANSISAGTANGMQTMSTAPSNSLNQLNLSGGYDFTSKTKLTGNASIGRNTQNAGFAVDSYMMIPAASGGVTPPGSMNGLVNTTHFDMKLTDQSVKDLTLSAGYKFDQRDNLTQSNIYSFSGIGGTGLPNIGSTYTNSTYISNTTTSAQSAYYPNTPLSLKQSLISLGGAYRISKDQRVSLDYANNTINRWCNQYGSGAANLTNVAANGGAGTYTAGSFPVGTNCVTATSSNENKVDALYKLAAVEGLTFKAGVGYANRVASLDQNAIAAFSQTNVNNAAFGKSFVPGQNAGDYLGFVPYFEASRKQASAKASTNWEVNDQLSFSLGGKYISETFPNSTYGVQNGYGWSLNLDGMYKYDPAGSVVAYATQQNMQRNIVNYNYTSSTVAGTWNNNLQSNATTLGLGVRQGDLVNGKLTLTGDLTYSLAQSWYSTNVGYLPSNGTSTACNAPATQSCGILPVIQNTMAIVKLGGSYQLDKSSRIGLMYWYQHLYSNDYAYNGMQTGYTPSGVLPTNQTSPSYNVNVISANYTYTFD